ncbi:thiamine-phosphate kinase [bacterium]|nr:thiamine-phosphate kinase [bacterium]
MGRVRQARKTTARRSGDWQEFQLIDWIRQCTQNQAIRREIHIGDDASSYRASGTMNELVTCDAMIEDVHWSWDWCDPRSLGYKIVAVNLSDIAAMGGIPKRAHLVLALPWQQKKAVVQPMLRSLIKTLNRHQVVLAGGDTVFSSGPMMITLTLQGEVAPQEMLLRSQAKEGDLLFVTGDLGAAAAGLDLLKQYKKVPSHYTVLTKKLLAPIPRVEAGRLLAHSGKVHAMLDLSDGLAGDVRHLAKASQVGIRLYTEYIPIALATRVAARHLKKDPLFYALCGGEDYELLFTASPKYTSEIFRLVQDKAKLSCHIIGQVVNKRQGIYQILPNGSRAPLPAGWQHPA